MGNGLHQRIDIKMKRSPIKLIKIVMVTIVVLMIRLQSTLLQEAELENRHSLPETTASDGVTSIVDTKGDSPVRNSFRNTENLWNSSSTLPEWMKEYMAWHQREREVSLTPEQWKDSTERPKLLIMQCMKSNVKCGGTSDRLKPLPLVLLGAHQSKRMLFIRWRDRPCELEKFMQPPQGGFDWSLPTWLDQELGDDYTGYSRRHIINVKPFLQQTKGAAKLDIVTATLQWWDGGEQAYKNELGESDEFRSLYHDLFRIMFEPTPGVQALLDEIWRTTALKPNEYAVAHYRALWWENQEPPSEKEQEETAINAVHCATKVRPGVPVYFATDAIEAQQSIQKYAVEHNRSIVVVPHRHLVHLDRVNLSTTKVEEIYPVFVDLWLMAFGRCLSFGDGGFGKYGLLLSSDFQCSFRHIYRHKIINCDWTQ